MPRRWSKKRRKTARLNNKKFAVFPLLILLSVAGCSKAIHRVRSPLLIIRYPILLDQKNNIQSRTAINRCRGGTSGSQWVQVPKQPRYLSLLSDAEQEMKLGNDDSAAAFIESSLEIDPKNPLLWNRLKMSGSAKQIGNRPMCLQISPILSL